MLVTLLADCSSPARHAKNDWLVAEGQMPALAVDKSQNIHLVYGRADTVFYTVSTRAGTFSPPEVVAVLPHVFTFATRGPQVAVSGSGILVTACTSTGNIYSYLKAGDGKWSEGIAINDRDTTAKEGLMALGADGNKAYAVWLDLRGNKRNKIYGASSADGGRSWLANRLVYASPDSSVCECCKPSVIVKGDNVYVMFRNWLKGNRDLYLTSSADGGNSFGSAGKLGKGSWPLDGCPMDGGAMTLNDKHEIQTVWRRGAGIYAAAPGHDEKQIGEGRGCTMETADGKNAYAWSQDDSVVVLTPNGSRQVVGTGSQPVLKAIGNDRFICVWENEKQVHAAVIE